MPDEFISYFSPELVDEVIERCKILIAASPGQPNYRRDLGHAYFKKGLHREALAEFIEAARLDPNDTGMSLAVGRCHELLGDLEQARVAFETACTKKPDWPDPYFWLGKIHFAAGRNAEALACLQKTLQINERFRDALYILALLHEKEGRLAESIATLKKLIALPAFPQRSQNPFPYEAELLFDDPILLDETIRQMESFLRTNTGFADIHFKLGMAYRRKGLKEQSMAEFRKALRINPNFHLARHYYWHWDDEKPSDDGTPPSGAPPE